MKKIIALLLAIMMVISMAACGNQNAGTQDEETKPTGNVEAENNTDNGEKEVLKFYHGYWHDEATWMPAVVMREIYQAFADAHADGDVIFEAIPVQDLAAIYENEIASGSFPDMIDMAGGMVPQSAIVQGLVYDMKPYIDAEGLQEQIGLNYTQNNVDGAIYTVHDQLMTLGMWVNADVLTATGASLPDWATWEDFAAAMETVRTAGASEGYYSYGSGQGSQRMFNAAMASTEAGIEMISKPLTVETVNSPEFETAFKTIAKMDQLNGSANSAIDVSDFTADFNDGKSAVFINGVWGAGSFAGNTSFIPTVYPCNVSLSAANGGITISSGLSEKQTALALEFVKYMTSPEVQTRIFLEVSANPCNPTLDLVALAENGDDTAKLLAEACSKCNNAATVVPTIESVWDWSLVTAINNKMTECTVSGADIDALFEEVKAELIALIG